MQQFIIGLFVFQNDGSGKIAQGGDDRFFRDIDESECLAGVRQFQNAGGSRILSSFQSQRHVVALAVQKTDSERDQKRLFFSLTGCRRTGLGEGNSKCPFFFVVVAFQSDAGVPAWLYQRSNCERSRPLASAIAARKVVACDGVAVMAAEIKVHAFSETVTAEKGLVHADDLSAFFVDGNGIEVVDFLIGIRTDGMGHGAGILGELQLPQGADIFDPFDGTARIASGQVCGEFLIAKNGQPFFQGKLEPVAAGDPVTGPVVEIFVTDDRFDVGVIGIGRDSRVGQDVPGVEDVQSLDFPWRPC